MPRIGETPPSRPSPAPDESEFARVEPSRGGLLSQIQSFFKSPRAFIKGYFRARADKKLAQAQKRGYLTELSKSATPAEKAALQKLSRNQLFTLKQLAPHDQKTTFVCLTESPKVGHLVLSHIEPADVPQALDNLSRLAVVDRPKVALLPASIFKQVVMQPKVLQAGVKLKAEQFERLAALSTKNKKATDYLIANPKLLKIALASSASQERVVKATKCLQEVQRQLKGTLSTERAELLLDYLIRSEEPNLLKHFSIFLKESKQLLAARDNKTLFYSPKSGEASPKAKAFVQAFNDTNTTDVEFDDGWRIFNGVRKELSIRAGFNYSPEGVLAPVLRTGVGFSRDSTAPRINTFEDIGLRFQALPDRGDHTARVLIAEPDGNTRLYKYVVPKALHEYGDELHYAIPNPERIDGSKAPDKIKALLKKEVQKINEGMMKTVHSLNETPSREIQPGTIYHREDGRLSLLPHSSFPPYAIAKLDPFKKALQGDKKPVHLLNSKKEKIPLKIQTKVEGEFLRVAFRAGKVTHQTRIVKAKDESVEAAIKRFANTELEKHLLLTQAEVLGVTV